jgi:hypothetical protein
VISIFVFGILQIQIGCGEPRPHPHSPATSLVKLLEERRNLVYKKKKKKAQEFFTLSYDVLVMQGNSRVVQHVIYYSFHLQK